MQKPTHNLEPTFVFDFDSTLITAESLDELARVALEGRPDQDEVVAELGRITTLGMTGDISFDESLDRRLQLFSANRGHVDQVTSMLQSQISPSALARRDWFQQRAEHIYVVSGGFEDIIVPVVKQLGVLANHVYANRFIYDEHDNIIGYDRSNLVCQPGGKAKQVEVLDLPQPIVAVGDGFTDSEIKSHGSAQEFWAFTETVSRPSVVALADRVLASFDENLELAA